MANAHQFDGVPPGRRIGNIEIERPIGRGGVAEVYLARRLDDGRPVAVKVIYAANKAMRSRLRIEGTVQQVLQHPNLVAVHEVVKIDAAPALVMEYVEGPTLAQWIADGGPDSPDAALAIFRDIVRGVQAAHAAGLIHRDLKPANILLQVDSRRPGALVPKITDFGLAKLMGLRGATVAGTAMGTPEYAAPEQGRDASSVDVRADLFSLGCILYELLAGRSPYAGLDTYRMLVAKKDQRYPRLAEVVPALPPGLSELVDDLLAYDPAARPADSDALAERLDALRPTDPLPPPTLTWRVVAPLLLLPVLAAIAGAAAVLLLG